MATMATILQDLEPCTARELLSAISASSYAEATEILSLQRGFCALCNVAAPARLAWGRTVEMTDRSFWDAR